MTDARACRAQDKDSLIARLVQARFTGMFRFSCKAFVDWMDSEGVAAAGSQAPREARYSNPAEYGSPYDRNILLIASVLTAESHLQETDTVMTPSIHEWWEQNCVQPNLHRSALPKATVELDSEVYGVKDALGHQVPLVDYGPLLSYGSLRQLRDTVDGGSSAESYPEDFTLRKDLGSEYAVDRERRWESSAQYMYTHRVCDPEFKYSIEHALGNPPFSTGDEIRDISSARVRKYDMSVSNEALGESAVDQKLTDGCGLQDACHFDRAPTYRSGSMWQFVYVTSSDDPSVRPGWHRLINLKIWPTWPCNQNADQTCGASKFPAGSKQLKNSLEELRKTKKVVKQVLKSKIGLSLSNVFSRTGKYSVRNSLGAAALPFGRRLSSRSKPMPTATPTPIPTATPAAELPPSLETLLGDIRASAGASEVGSRALLMHELAGNLTDARHDRRRMPFFLPLLGYVLSTTLASTVVGLAVGGAVARAIDAALEAGITVHEPVFLSQINVGAERPRAVEWRTGKEALFAVRCSDKLHVKFPDDIKCCMFNPDGGTSGCLTDEEHQYDRDVDRRDYCNPRELELADSRKDTLPEFIVTRLTFYPPPSPFSPSPSPPPPVTPPATPPPPAPPVAVSAGFVRAQLFEAQRAFCDTVYISSAEARCTRLAQTLQQAYIYEGDSWTPPHLPPVAPDVAPPPSPPPPPLPAVPLEEQAHIFRVTPEAVFLSTYFVADRDGEGEGAQDKGARTPLAQETATRDAVFASIQDGVHAYGQWAACDADLADAPLPCRSADLERRCLSGGVRCKPDHLDNMRDPWVELDLLNSLPHVETNDPRYFFGLEIELPPEEEYGKLLFRSVGGAEDIGYEVETFDQHHAPTEGRAQCQTWRDQTVTAHSPGLRSLQFVCLPALASEEDYATMRTVRYVRLALYGELRMVWVDSLTPIFRTLRDTNPSPPAPPNPPPPPPGPGAPPDLPESAKECDFYSDALLESNGFVNYDWYPGATTPVVVLEQPCGLSPKACCELAHVVEASSFYIDVSGCCTQYVSDGAQSTPPVSLSASGQAVAASTLDVVGVKGTGVVEPAR